MPNYILAARPFLLLSEIKFKAIPVGSVHWLHKRQSGKLPPTLLEAASWACPQLGPFVRQAVGVAVRRGLARAVNATHVHVPPPPPPAAPVAVRPRLTPWMDAARAGGVVVRELQ